MMCKHKISWIILSCFFVFAGCFFVSGSFANPESIEFGGKQCRGPVAFPHELHMEGFECLECHHVMEGGENVLDESDLEEGNPDVLCASCHNPQSSIERREAFHYQCIRCHDSEAKGPTLCGECHTQKK